MPLFEFFCKSCGKRFEEFCRDYKENEASCPQCQKKAPKVFSTFASSKSGASSNCGG